jgi:hypothetical protein
VRLVGRTGGNVMSSSIRRLILRALIAIAAFVICDVGTVRSQIVQASPTNKRYLVYRVLWGFDPTFPGAIDEAANDGFNAMLLNIPWVGVQFMDGYWDFSFLDREVAYVVGKNLPVALNIQLGRPPGNASNGNDTVLSPRDYMQDFSGGCICKSWGIQFSFASDNFIQKANAFIQAVVSRYYTLYPKSILYVTVTTTSRRRPDTRQQRPPTIRLLQTRNSEIGCKPGTVRSPV